MKEAAGFTIWLTGIPASGKSSIAGELAAALRNVELPIVVLESDEMRKIFTPEPAYTEEERSRFYHQLVLTAGLITKNGVNVILDATGNKRKYRDPARRLITRFAEVLVDCPLSVCRERDPKGIYARAERHQATIVPGAQVPYEPPLHPDLTVDGRAAPPENARLILNKLKQLFFI